VDASQPIARQLWPDLRDCFGCDPDHPHGLRLEGQPRDGAVVARWEPDARYQSWPGIVHGGILATVLDELTGWAANLAFRERDGDDPRPVVTAEATVRYRAPALVGRPLTATARVAEHGEEHAIVEAELANEDGVTVATCRTRYVRLRERPDWTPAGG
jgi:uncharacterized protein (TIGR00369 family)